MKTILALILVMSVSALTHAESEHYVGFGLFTEHYIQDSDKWNEHNDLMYYHYRNGHNVAVVGTFNNSYFIRSHVVAAGREYDLFLGAKVGVMLGLIEGYQTVLNANCGNKIICLPLLYIKTGPFTHMFMGPAYNLSLSVKF